MAFKDVYVFSSGGHFVHWSSTILAILLGCYLGNITVKSELHWHKGLGGGSI